MTSSPCWRRRLGATVREDTASWRCMNERGRGFLGVAMVVTLVLLSACAPSDPAASARGPDAVDPRLVPSVPEPVRGQGMVTDRTTVVVSVEPQWEPGSGGIGMSDDWGEHPVLLEPPVPVSVLAGPVTVDGEEWYQVYVLPDSMRWPSDFSAWVPATHDGADVLDVPAPTDCPDAEAGQIGALSPTGRVACFGDQTLRFAARSWLGGHWVPYEVEPAWLGTSIEDTRTVSLFEAGGGEFPRPPDPRILWIDARVPPDIEMPPFDVTLLVEAQFDHPEARDCRRTRDRSGPPPQPATAGLPDEPADASGTWCRGQLVLTGWDLLLGPEGRPPWQARSSSTARHSRATSVPVSACHRCASGSMLISPTRSGSSRRMVVSRSSRSSVQGFAPRSSPIWWWLGRGARSLLAMGRHSIPTSPSVRMPCAREARRSPSRIRDAA